MEKVYYFELRKRAKIFSRTFITFSGLVFNQGVAVTFCVSHTNNRLVWLVIAWVLALRKHTKAQPM